MTATLDLSNTLGALLIGTIISTLLFGVTCLQTFYYFQNHGSDRLLIKLLITILLVSETLHTVFSTYSIYYYVIVNYDNPVTLLDSNWSISAEFAQSSVAVFAVHIFYTRRVYYVSKKNVPLAATIFALALVHFGTHIVLTVKCFQIHLFKLSSRVVPYLGTSLLLAAATDIAIVASLSFYLHKNRSGVQNTDTLVNRLILHAVSNGILTSVLDVLVFIFALLYPQNMIYIALYQVISNLYVNSVLATLNSRQSMARAGDVTKISFGVPRSTFIPDMSTSENGEHKSNIMQPTDTGIRAIASEP
ncbi:hypothetical protein BDZ94DRAFT_1300644 [Collybia nuda]|uniref:DUF6534 domain-containing protein n=1 Tax=Collybia nuda TaxID=64659 RepID=A0A9P6CBC5_9AGAR|nr:hypothetical protein BDZ94DRAFT_1300644 [Collybia nuda]